MKRKTISISFIAICTFLLSIEILKQYRVWSHSPQGTTINKKSQIIAKNSVLPIPTGAGDIQNSKTWSRYMYNNEFSLAYPTFWNVVPDKDGAGVSFMTTGFHQDDDFSMPYGNSYDVSYTIFGEHDISDMQLKNGDQFSNDITSETMVVTNMQHIKIDGYQAVAFDYYPTDNTDFLQSRISILKGKNMYRFNAIYAHDTNKKLFDEMIQSLKFTH